mgnify:FL=1
MFETQEGARIDSRHFPDRDVDIHTWSDVMTRSDRYWLHVAGALDIDGDKEVVNFFLWRPDDLVPIAAAPGYSISEVGLVSPPAMNRTRHWAMTPLWQVLRGKESGCASDRYGYIFVVEPLLWYTVSPSGGDVQLIDMEVLYSSIE